MIKKTINEEGIRGVLLYPEDKEIKGSVLLVPGSDGGIPDGYARKIAQEGFLVLALGYFAIDNRPERLECIALEYFEKALKWFKGEKVHVVGYSRGGELALLLGCYFTDLVASIVAFVPNAYITGGFPHPNLAAWEYQGRLLEPFLGGLVNADPTLKEAEDLELATRKGLIPFHAGTKEDPFEVTDLFMARDAKFQKDLEKMAIPVEKIKAPILILSGEKDAIWPSTMYAERIMQRLDKAGSHIHRAHIAYQDAGHGIAAHYEGSVYHPNGKFYCRFGGTPIGNQKANSDSFFQLIKFISFE